MQVYPAIKAKMGRWDYYLVRMSMREISQNVRYAEEIHGPTQLSDAIQRGLNTARATGMIARYLARHEDRFFGSIVVAALGGEPQWHPVSLEDDAQFRILSRDSRLTEAFGVLTFDGNENYYALDGQHRLAAIRSLLDGMTDFSPPQHFRDEEVSVLIVTPRQLEDADEFMLRYRRLFGHLNRYAKPMSQYDNIIMDEDDALAIVTRRIVSQHEFFRSYSVSQFDSARVKMKPGKNLPAGSPHFTSLENLYDINFRLLFGRRRRNHGWGQHEEQFKVYHKFRPPDEEVDLLEQELKVYWDALVGALPILREDPTRMRDHRPQERREDPDASADCVLFWPIVQLTMTDVARALLDDEEGRASGADSESDNLSVADAQRAFLPLASVEWDAHSSPWRHILLIQSGEEGGSWRIASEDRTKRLRLLERVIRWQIGIDPLTEDEVTGDSGLKSIWYSYLPASAASTADDMWAKIEAGVRR